ncbi:type II toxin-antitoxin system Phd/YefM family antitoxin [Roseovarius sp. D22-M7]|uniref:type II toxin-antitoxin system Phd/YefM family antitoxin n=1 Tax=Roseovarius sp. D22-M7 TaxID=3127116 RepID=UPI00301015DA
MSDFTTPATSPPIPEISIAELCAHLRGYLEEVRLGGQQVIVTRHGRPLAGIVTTLEARSLWRVAHEREVYAEWRMMRHLDEDRRLRMAVIREAQADCRAEYEKRVRSR